MTTTENSSIPMKLFCSIDGAIHHPHSYHTCSVAWQNMRFSNRESEFKNAYRHVLSIVNTPQTVSSSRTRQVSTNITTKICCKSCTTTNLITRSSPKSSATSAIAMKIVIHSWQIFNLNFLNWLIRKNDRMTANKSR